MTTLDKFDKLHCSTQETCLDLSPVNYTIRFLDLKEKIQRIQRKICLWQNVIPFHCFAGSII